MSGRRSRQGRICIAAVTRMWITGWALILNAWFTPWQVMTIEEIEANYVWPVADWFDYSVLGEQVQANEHRPIRGGGSEPFLKYAELRGLEQAYMDLIENPELVAYCLDRLFDFAYQHTRRIFEAIPGKVLISYVAEDFGSQESLLFSPPGDSLDLPAPYEADDRSGARGGGLCLFSQRWRDP